MSIVVSRSVGAEPGVTAGHLLLAWVLSAWCRHGVTFQHHTGCAAASWILAAATGSWQRPALYLQAINGIVAIRSIEIQPDPELGLIVQEEWQAEFAKYQRSPEFNAINRWELRPSD